MNQQPTAPVSPAIGARIIHGSLVLGVVLFWGVVWFTGKNAIAPTSPPATGTLYIVLGLGSLVFFAAAVFAARQLPPLSAGLTPDRWWTANLGRAIVVWSLVEAPALFGLVMYFLSRNSRVLIAPLLSLLLFASFRPSRLTES